MNQQSVLRRSIELVGVLFASFSGYLLHIAPPQNDATGVTVEQATGIASFLALIVLLLLSSLPRSWWSAKYRVVWSLLGGLTALGFAVFAVSYQRSLREATFVLPPEGGPGASTYVHGTELQPSAAKYLKLHPDKSDGELVMDFGGAPAIALVWSKTSVDQVELQLTRRYLFVVVLLSTAIFSLVEVTMAGESG